MAHLVEFTSDEGTVYIEVDEKLPVPKRKPEDKLISQKYGIEIKAKNKFEEALDGIKPVANAIIKKVNSLNEPASEVQVKFGVKMSAELGAIIASGSGEVNYEITLKWDNKKKNQQLLSEKSPIEK
ncbi:MAG: CU044_2847 family protein [Crocosphaera sp.]